MRASQREERRRKAAKKKEKERGAVQGKRKRASLRDYFQVQRRFFWLLTGCHSVPGSWGAGERLALIGVIHLSIGLTGGPQGPMLWCGNCLSATQQLRMTSSKIGFEKAMHSV